MINIVIAGQLFLLYKYQSLGRLRMEYMQQIIEDQGCTSYKETKRKASNREEWRIATNQSQD